MGPWASWAVNLEPKRLRKGLFKPSLGLQIRRVFLASSLYSACRRRPVLQIMHDASRIRSRVSSITVSQIMIGVDVTVRTLTRARSTQRSLLDPINALAIGVALA